VLLFSLNRAALMPPAAELVAAQQALLPKGLDSHTAQLPSGLEMHWFQLGSGPIAVLLHGFPEIPLSYAKQLEALSDSYTLVVPHLRGYGPTHAPIPVSEYRLHNLGQDVLELIRLNAWGPVHLVGHDWGGTVAWEVAMQDSAAVRSLTVLNSCPPRVLLHRFVRSGQVRRSWYMFLFQWPGLAERWLRRQGTDGLRALFLSTASRKSAFLQADLSPYVMLTRARDFGGVKYYRAALRSPMPTLRRVRCPSQLVWGVDDPALGRHLADEKAYAGWVDDFAVHLIQGAGHWVQQEAHEEVNAHLRQFWGRHDP
jgi:pimeloyl-ACP methyl ester carboxylesterase